MKKFIKFRRIAYLFLLLTSMAFITSCDEVDDEEITELVDASVGAPVVTAIRTVNFEEEYDVVTQGVIESTYTIHGQNLATTTSISFNGYDAYFNPTFVTDNLIFVSVPEDAPYLNQSDILRIETLAGVVEVPFSLLTIEEFTEETIDGKSVVRLIGGDFSDVEEVIFESGSEDTDDLVERPATILSFSDSEIIAEIPPGVLQAFIFVNTTRGASASSESFGFNYPVYIDAIGGWDIGGWGGPQEESAEVVLGTTSVKKTSAQWEGLTFTPNDTAEDLVFADYSTVSFQVYGGPTVNSLNFAVNDFEAVIGVTVVPGVWTKVEIPLRDFYPNGGAPEVITRMDFQLSSEGGTDQFYYVDQFGFIQ